MATIFQQPFKIQGYRVLGRAIFKPPHRASSQLVNEARFVYVVNGRCKLFSPTMNIDLQSGDCVLMKCENFINNWFENTDQSRSEIIVFVFTPEILQAAYDSPLIKIYTPPEQPIANPLEKIVPNKHLKNFLNSMVSYFQQPTLLEEELLKVKIRELLFLLTKIENNMAVQTILSELFEVKDYKFQEVIHANIYEEINLDELAFMTGLSLSSFQRKFNSIFGISPARYIKSKRLEKAKKLIEQSDLRISEIAYATGFKDLGHFSKSFADVYSVSPSMYRKQVLK